VGLDEDITTVNTEILKEKEVINPNNGRKIYSMRIQITMEKKSTNELQNGIGNANGYRKEIVKKQATLRANKNALKKFK
jgi:hypothetical protein